MFEVIFAASAPLERAVLAAERAEALAERYTDRAHRALAVLTGKPVPPSAGAVRAFAAGWAAGYRAALTNSDAPREDFSKEGYDA